MKKKNLSLSRLTLNKETITAMNGAGSINGGSGETDKYHACYFTAFLSCRGGCITIGDGDTCRQDMCGLAPSKLSCAQGPGCASNIEACSVTNACHNA